MQPANLLLFTLAFAAIAYWLGYTRSRTLATPLGGIRHLKSLPFYYGDRAARWCGIPALLPDSDGQASLLLSQISNVASGALPRNFADPAIVDAADRLIQLRGQSQLYMNVLVIAVAVLTAFLAWLRIHPRLNARVQVEIILKWLFFACAGLAILTTVGIIFSVAFETLSFFQQISFFDFIFGTHWSPQTALRADQVASQGAFGMIPLFTGTLLISGIAMLVAVPVGLMSAIYLSEYANPKVRGPVHQ